MPESQTVAEGLLDCLDHAHAETDPFRYWLLRGMLPRATCAAIDALAVTPPAIGETMGRRETHNSSRLFFGAEQRARHSVCDDVAQAFQCSEVVQRLEGLCDVCLVGGSLRIEYCLDTDGFWLEPHTDIGAKLFTMLIYLSDEPGCEAWGTDLYDTDQKWVGRSPYERNCGMIFVPGSQTWHGVEPRPIQGVRRS